MQELSLSGVLERAWAGMELSSEDILYLLNLRDVQDVAKLQRAARMVRDRHFGNRVFLYGFLYFSTYCQNDCSFCSYRRSNTALRRYRKNEGEIVEAALWMRESGVHLIDLTMGEDPLVSDSELGLAKMIDLVRRLRREVGLPVMISPGVLSDEAINGLAAAGADWFACYQETHSRELFNRLRVGQSFDRRMHAKERAGKAGMLIEEGILTGVGETPEDIAGSLLRMREMKADQVRAMTFVPQQGTPMASRGAADGLLEQIIISVMRLIMPEALIPASLDVDGLDGVEGRLQAGANVITSIVPPGQGLAGVANGSLDIEDSRRTVGSLHGVLTRVGMKAASLDEYRDWMEARKSRFSAMPANSANVV